MNPSKPVRRLPVFRERDIQSQGMVFNQLAAAILGSQFENVDNSGGRELLAKGSMEIEWNRGVGSIWMWDTQHLWNYRPDLEIKLPQVEEARTQNQKLLQLFTSGTDAETVQFHNLPVRSTMVRIYDVKGQTPINGYIKLDMYLSHQILLRHESVLATELIPVIGEAGKLAMTVGDQGRLLHCNCGWLGIEEDIGELPVIPEEDITEDFRNNTRAGQMDSLKVSLGYQRIEYESMHFLIPVYVLNAMIQINDRIVPLRQQTMPAVTIEDLLPHARHPRHIVSRRPPLRSPQIPWIKRPTAATSYIIDYLPHSETNACCFAQALRDQNWNIVFEHGGPNALHRDWIESAETGVEEANVVFYSGHAAPRGWTLTDKDVECSDPALGSRPASPGRLFGSGNLNWIVIAGCGPLEEDLHNSWPEYARISVGGDVFQRWQGVFDGLHLFMGYASANEDTPYEGETFIQHSTNGHTLLHSWFRTARELQGSTVPFDPPFGPEVWAGAMAGQRIGDLSPLLDHLPGHGQVAPDPTDPDLLIAIWTPC